jgi:hypothetical protein
LKFSGPKLYMLIVHALFGFVALFHFCGLMFGYEKNNIKLGEGNSFSIGNEFEIKVNRVNFVNDSSVLSKEYINIKKNEFDYKKNYAELVLTREGKEVLRDKVYILRPFTYGNIRITLRNFIPSEDKDKLPGKKVIPWINLTITRNPALRFFLALYPLMILGIFIHLMLTWESPSKRSMNGSS